jgi:hypothetical protein
MSKPWEIITARPTEWEEIYPVITSKKISPLTCAAVKWNSLFEQKHKRRGKIVIYNSHLCQKKHIPYYIQQD